MKRGQLKYLLGLIIISASFASVPNKVGEDFTIGFLFHDIRLHPQTWVHYTLIHVFICMQAFYMWKESNVYRPELKVWFCIMCFHACEYLLKYSSIFYRTDYINFSSRWVTALFFGYYIFKDREDDFT